MKAGHVLVTKEECAKNVAMMYVKNVLRMVYVQIVNRRIKMERCEKHTNTKCPTPCPVCLIEEREQLQADNERMENALERISRWAKAYPLEVFPEPDFVEVRKALKEHGISLDAVSASNMRHVIKGVSDIVDNALNK